MPTAAPASVAVHLDAARHLLERADSYDRISAIGELLASQFELLAAIQALAERCAEAD